MYSTKAVGRFECSRWETWDWPSHISIIPGECTCAVPGLSVALNVWGGPGTGPHTFLLYLVSVHVQYQGCRLL